MISNQFNFPVATPLIPIEITINKEKKNIEINASSRKSAGLMFKPSKLVCPVNILNKIKTNAITKTIAKFPRWFPSNSSAKLFKLGITIAPPMKTTPSSNTNTSK